jgi:hypothetical protein
VAPNCRMVNPFLKSPLKMWYTLRTTPKPHLLAEVIPSFPAYAALTTWYAYLERHSVTNTEAIDLGSDRHDNTRRFMTKGQRRACTEISIGKFLIVAHIRATNPG